LSRNTVSAMMMALLVLGAIALAFNVQPVRAQGTTYIRADGSIDPPTVPISTVDNITYTFTGDISDSIVIERDNIVVDGASFTVQGTGSGTGIDLSGRRNVTIKNTEITTFSYGIWLRGSWYNSISGNKITNNDYGVAAEGMTSLTQGNSISENNITANNGYGIYLLSSSDNTISGNNITNDHYGIYLDWHANYNSISGNNITANNGYGIYLDSSSGNRVFHNNFINNTRQVYPDSSVNVWDNNYPSGGNYWSNYTGLDQKCGPSQDQPGSDGMGDTPYIIDSNNMDNYPLMNPWTPPPNVAVVSIVSTKTVIGQGFSGNITVNAANRGEYPETFNVTLSAQNQTAVNQTGLVGYWKFDEGSGTTAYDSSGNGNNGILVNGPTWVAGKYGEALSFEGVDDYVEIAGNTDLNPYTNDWTVSAWVNLNKLCPYIYGQPFIYGFVILGKRQSEFDNSLTLLVHSGTNATSQARFGFIWDGSMQAAGAQSDLMNVFGWHYVVGVRRGGELYVYVDGVEYGPNNYFYAGSNITSTTSISSATPVRLASHGSWFFYNGTIDEARIYDRALSAGEILAQYEGVKFAIQTRTVTLAKAASAALAFVWNTTGSPYGNYTISAYAEPVLGETDTADNNFTGGWVIVAGVGDLTGGTPNPYDFVPDGKVLIEDVSIVAKFFGQKVPPAPANVDLTGPTITVPDGKILIDDVATVSKHFGQHYP